MSLATLAAPAHLRGPMPRTVDPGLLADRNGWIMGRLAEGHTYREVGDALGLTFSAIYLVAKKARDPKATPEPSPRDEAAGKLKFQVVGVTPAGKTIGHVIHAANEAAAARRWLASYPAGSSVAEVKVLGGESA